MKRLYSLMVMSLPVGNGEIRLAVTGSSQVRLRRDGRINIGISFSVGLRRLCYQLPSLLSLPFLPDARLHAVTFPPSPLVICSQFSCGVICSQFSCGIEAEKNSSFVLHCYVVGRMVCLSESRRYINQKEVSFRSATTLFFVTNFISATSSIGFIFDSSCFQTISSLRLASYVACVKKTLYSPVITS